MTDVVYALHRITWPDYERGLGNWATINLLRTLAASPRVDRLLVADPFRSAAVLVKRRGAPPLPTSADVHHTAPLRARRQDPLGVEALQRTYRAWDAWVGLAARRHGLRRPAVITVNPLVAGFSPLRWAGPVTYHGTDDWLAAEILEPCWPGFRTAYAAIGRRGHAVTGVSDLVVQRVGPTGPARVVPNGIDPAEWLEPGPVPAWLADRPRPWAVYVGTLDTRLDVAQLEAAHEALGSGTLVLIGPREDRAQLAPIRALPRALVHEAVGRVELAAAVSASDVGLVPHVRDELTIAMSPLKVFEYLAAGLPVVGAELPGVQAAVTGDRVLVAGTPGEFGAAVGRALALGRADESDRLAWIEANSWAARHEELLEVALRT